MRRLCVISVRLTMRTPGSLSNSREMIFHELPISHVIGNLESRPHRPADDTQAACYLTSFWTAPVLSRSRINRSTSLGEMDR
jgi:hypothetical protein